MFERLRLKTTAGAGAIGFGGPPCQVGGQVAFAGSHLVEPSCSELAQAHKGPWVQGGEVVVVPWRREEAWPLRKKGLLDPRFQGGVSVVHQGPSRGG